jgi:general secretion pathway protein G
MHRRGSSRLSGFQLVELLIGIAIISVVAAIAYPSYTQHVDKARNATAISAISQIDQSIERFYVRNGRLPDTLAQAGAGARLDPWDNPYRYLRIAGSGLRGKGSLRKDKALNPVNTDYDLYSMGKDGATQLPFTAPVSFDDIVRCNNGRYVGLAGDY